MALDSLLQVGGQAKTPRLLCYALYLLVSILVPYRVMYVFFYQSTAWDRLSFDFLSTVTFLILVGLQTSFRTFWTTQTHTGSILLGIPLGGRTFPSQASWRVLQRKHRQSSTHTQRSLSHQPPHANSRPCRYSRQTGDQP